MKTLAGKDAGLVEVINEELKEEEDEENRTFNGIIPVYKPVF